VIQSIFSKAEHLRRKFETRNPFELLDALNVTTKFTNAYQHLKGYCAVQNQIVFVVISEKLPEEEQIVVAGHECGHFVWHPEQLKKAPFKDYDIYQVTGKFEREANFLGADFMLDDEEVMDLMRSDGADFFSVAKTLKIPAPFFAFKIYSMADRGFALRVPVELDSTFLAR